MNHIYRSTWNDKTGTFVATSEIAASDRSSGGTSGGRQRSIGGRLPAGVGAALKALAVSVMMAFGSHVYALPEDGVVAAGAATISSGTGTMTIRQSSQNVALNWQSFNIGRGEAVRFVQPNSSAVALNRVLGSDPSRILGNLSANGKVFLVNPNGILFGQGASVNVGGLVASTLGISDSDFMAGHYKFSGAGGGSILNQGSINATGGYVALLGANVSNHGVIAARMGTIALAAGEAITLDVAGDGLLNVSIEQGAVDALVNNGGMLQADGGHVLLSAQAAGNLLNTVVNNTGVIQALTIEDHDGTIRLLGDMQTGTVNVTGTLDASAPDGGDGGFIDTSAATVTVADGTIVTTAAAQGLTGSWLIDPTDYTIAATGGDITGAQLSANLVTTGVTIESTAGHKEAEGDVNVDDTVTWSANKLTLKAQNDININTAMHGSGTASLALEYGLAAVAAGNTSTVNVNAPVNLPAGQNLSKKLGSDGAIVTYTVITSLGAAGSTTGTDLQGMNGNKGINYALGSNVDASATSAWEAGKGFTSVGNSGSPFTGTFDGLGHTISNLSIARPTEGYVGVFGSTADASEVRNIGLVNVSLAGANKQVGALIGSNRGKVRNSYATGNVRGATFVGGLAGENLGSIDGSYFSGSVVAGNRLGGLVGVNKGSISNSYSTGQVTSSAAQNMIGGLVGHNERGTISTSYASAKVFNSSTDPSHTGGLVGSNSGGVFYSYWNTTANSGLPAVGDGGTTGMTGLTEAQMKTVSNFSGFNFTNTPGAAGNNWVIVDIDGTLNNAGGAVGATRPMLATEYSTTINNAHQLQLMAIDPTASYTLGSDINAASTGLGNDAWGSPGFSPIRTFSGSFDGRNHTISGIAINQPLQTYMGLFAYANRASRISNVGLVGGSVNGDSYSGSLVGRNEGVISNSYSTVNVNGGSGGYAGGLVGWMDGGIVSNSYAAGTVASLRAGGLVGRNEGMVRNSYASGAVTGANSGGLTGLNDSGVVTNSSWDIDTTGRTTSAGGTGLTTAAMVQLASFSNWNIANAGGSGAVWRIYEGQTSPLLRSFMTALTLTGAPDVAVTYNGNVQSGASIATPSGVLGVAATGTNAGFYNGYYSSQQGYDISGGDLTINKADVAISTSDISKTYDGGVTAAGTATVTSGTLFAGDSISGGTFAFTDKNVGSGDKTVTATGVTVSDGNSGGNYDVIYADNTTSTIAPKALTVAGVTALDKVYDGTTLATLAGGTLAGIISGDTVTLIEAGTFATPSAGNGIVVTAAVSLSGTSAPNYTVTQPTGLTANITAPIKPVPVSGIDSDMHHQHANASALSLMFAMPLQSIMADAELPSLQNETDASMPGGLTGLNLTITGPGVKLPPCDQVMSATKRPEC